MYVTIRRYENDAALADRLAARSDEIQAIMSSVAGFQAYYLARAGDGTASVTVCEDKAGADETNRIAATWLRENMPEAASAAPQVTAGEVALSF